MAAMNTELTLQTVNSAILRDAAAAPKSNAASGTSQFEVQLLPTGSLFDCVGVVLDLSPAVAAPPAAQSASAPQSSATPLMTYANGGTAIPTAASPAGGASPYSGQVLNVAA